MFCPYKNSYLQLVCAVNPKIINSAVEIGMQQSKADLLPSDLPPAHRLESMQPSIYCPHVDITRSTLGFGRIGLRLLNRDLLSPDFLVQLQALHTLMDQLQISEHALFLINLNVVYRLIGLMKNDNKVIREKVCLIYTHLTCYYQARQQITKRPIILDNLIWLVLNDQKEIRYVAAYALWTMTKFTSLRKMLVKTENIVLNLLKTIKSDHMEIAILHLKTVARLSEYDAEPALRSNGFQIMRKLLHAQEPRLVAAAMNVMTQMCKHPVGRKLADKHYMTWKVRKYLYNADVDVMQAAAGLIKFTSVTSAVKFRAREYFSEIVRSLVILSRMSNKPQLQLQSMQALINLCDSIDVRLNLKACWLSNVKSIRIKNPVQWDGSTGDDPGFDSGHYYRTKYIGQAERIHNFNDDNFNSVNVYNYVKTLRQKKSQLINAINQKSYKD